MEKPITISYRWTAEEMLLLHRLHRQHSGQGSKFRRTAWGVGILCVALLVVLPFQNHGGALSAAIEVFVLSGFLMAMPFFIRRGVLKAYAQKPDRDMAITYELSEDRLTCRSEIATTDLLWRAVRKVLRTPEGFLLYSSEQSIHWLPVRGFQDETGVERFAKFASAEVQGYEDVAKGKSKSDKTPLISRQARKYVIIWLALVLFLLLTMSAPNGNRYGHLMAQSMMAHGNVSETFQGDTLTIRYQYEVDGRMFRGQGPAGTPNKPVAQLTVGDPLEVY